MAKYLVILKSLKKDDERIVLSEGNTLEYAETMRKGWRKVLGNKNWTVDRRPGLDTIDHLALTIVKIT